MKNLISEMRNLTSQKQSVFKFFSFFSPCRCLSPAKFKISVSFMWMLCSILLLFVFCYFSTFISTKVDQVHIYRKKSEMFPTFLRIGSCKSFVLQHMEYKVWMIARPLRIFQCSKWPLSQEISYSRHCLRGQAYFGPEFLDDCQCQHLISST